MTQRERTLRKIDKLELHAWTLIAKGVKGHRTDGLIKPKISLTSQRVLTAQALFEKAAVMRESLRLRELARVRERLIREARECESKPWIVK